MFDRYSDRSRQAMFYANWFAIKTGSNHITPDHIFAGILIQDDGVAIQILKQMSVSTASIREWYGLQHQKKDYSSQDTRLPLAEASQHMIDKAVRLCRSYRHYGVGTEHLFLSWLSYKNEASKVFLENAGLTFEMIEAEVIELLAGHQDRGSVFFRLFRFLRRLCGRA